MIERSFLSNNGRNNFFAVKRLSARSVKNIGKRRCCRAVNVKDSQGSFLIFNKMMKERG